MKYARNVIASLLTLVALVSCSGKMPASPSPPTSRSPVRGSVTISALSPGSGATVNLHDCSQNGWQAICTEELQLVLDVVLERSVPDASVRISFYDESAPCVHTWISNVSFAAGKALALNTATSASKMYAQYQVSEGGEKTTIQPCELPATTGRLSVEIFTATYARTPVFSKEFAASYTFAAPPTNDHRP